MKLYWVGSELVPYLDREVTSAEEAGKYVHEQYLNGLDRNKVGFLLVTAKGEVFWYSREVLPVENSSYWEPAGDDRYTDRRVVSQPFDLAEVEEEIFKSVVLTPLNEAEMVALIERVKTRVAGKY